MKLSLIQFTIENNINDNFVKIKKLLDESLTSRPDFILLPECFLFLSSDHQEVIDNAIDFNSDYLSFFKSFCKKNSVLLLLGSIAIKENNKLYNCSILIDSTGVIISIYKKIHMFDVILKNGEEYKESDLFESGKVIQLIKLKHFMLGHAICYDLRFPKLFRALAKNGAQLIVLPSAFTKTTGKDHWHTLVRARAIENGIFIVAPNACGTNRDHRSTFGHSLVVGPWGGILADGGENENVINCDINLGEVEFAQKAIPALKHDINFEINTKNNFDIDVNYIK